MVSGIRKTKNSIKQLFITGMYFEDMGITYLGPVDGHNIKKLYRTFKEAQKVDGAVLVHVMTKKGKGYAPAENCPTTFHGVAPFDIETGKPIEANKSMSYTDVFGKAMCRLGEENEKIVAITAAMKGGTGLTKFGELYPKRFFDVGIAEAHAVTFSAGLAAAGMRPVFAVYSSFLQRGYDQLVHDVCMQNLPVTFAIDRAGLVGNDGETHQGAFDLAYLSHIPNMTILSPKNGQELEDMMEFAVSHQGPVAVRYPRGNAWEGMAKHRAPIVLGKSEVIYEESGIAILSVGHMMKTANEVRECLKEKGYACSLINARFVKPIDEELLLQLAKNHKLIVTIEDGVANGGYGSNVSKFISDNHLNTKVLINGLPDEYISQGSIAWLHKLVGLDVTSIVNKIEWENR